MSLWFKDPEIGIEITTLAAFGRTIYDMVKTDKPNAFMIGWIRRTVSKMDERVKAEAENGTNRANE